MLFRGIFCGEISLVFTLIRLAVFACFSRFVYALYTFSALHLIIQEFFVGGIFVHVFVFHLMSVTHLCNFIPSKHDRKSGAIFCVASARALVCGSAITIENG